MMMLVTQIVFDEIAKSDGLIVANFARSAEAFFGDAVDNSGEDFVLDLPPLQEPGPILISVAMRCHPGLLRVFRTRVS